MSLRLRLISLIAIVLIASFTVEALLASFHASRSVRMEMNSALQVAGQIVRNTLAELKDSPAPQRHLEALVVAFKGNRHLRVAWIGNEAAKTEPSREGSYFGKAPQWFIRFLGIDPQSLTMPIRIGGQDYGTILLKTDPTNEILEVWNDLGNGLIVLGLFFGLDILLVYFFIGHVLRPLGELSFAFNAIGQGDYRFRISATAVPEVARLLDGLNRMAAELLSMDEEQRRLNAKLLTLQEEERREIARDLHDEISPFLFAVNVDLATISRLADQGQTPGIVAQIRSTQASVSHMQGQIRAMLARLRPGVLSDFGLSAALSGLIDFWRQRHPDITFTACLPPEEAQFGELIDITIYRIVQEGLSNALKHGNPREVLLSVTTSPSSEPNMDLVTVLIRNDGQGAGAAPAFGFGLTGMRERVEGLGGGLVLTSDSSPGLTVRAELPFRRKMANRLHLFLEGDEQHNV
ncbi:MAG TPA: histidine kinase [Methylocella sp.]|nr:histidine kinase [Methylocella sp.]